MDSNSSREGVKLMERSVNDPVDIVRSVVAALNRGAIEDVLCLCADDIVLWAPGPSLEGQQIHGKEQLRQHLEFTEASWPGTWVSIDSIVASGERVALEMTTVVTVEDETVVHPMAAFYTIRDGLI